MKLVTNHMQIKEKGVVRHQTDVVDTTFAITRGAEEHGITDLSFFVWKLTKRDRKILISLMPSR